MPVALKAFLPIARQDRSYADWPNPFKRGDTEGVNLGLVDATNTGVAFAFLAKGYAHYLSVFSYLTAPWSMRVLVKRRWRDWPAMLFATWSNGLRDGRHLVAGSAGVMPTPAMLPGSPDIASGQHARRVARLPANGDDWQGRGTAVVPA